MSEASHAASSPPGPGHSPGADREVAVIFGTRPEVIKLAPVVRALDAAPGLRPVTIWSGQHTDLARTMLDHFGITSDHALDVMTPGQSPAQVLGRVIDAVTPVLAATRPAMVLVQGDTTTTLAGALAASYLRIPVGHVEAGLRTRNLFSPFPEEMQRRMVTRISSLHLASTERNVTVLRDEGVDPATIHLTGNPVIDALLWTRDHTRPSEDARALLAATEGTRRIVLTTHRRESFGGPLEANLRVLAEFVDAHDDVSLVFPVHPNPAVRAAAQSIFGAGDRVHLTDPMAYPDFVALLDAAWLVVSDSGGVQEEVPSLGKPLLVLRETTERPEAVEAGLARLVGNDPEGLRRELREAHAGSDWADAVCATSNPFGEGHAAERIVAAVARTLGDPAPR